MTSIEELAYERRRIRLALGIEPIDAGRRNRAARLYAAQETAHGLRSIARHPSGVFSLLASEVANSTAALRFTEPARGYVPRRFSIALQTGTPRVLTLRFYPGAAYGCSLRTTAIRGRVLRGAPPKGLRWARIQARMANGVPGTGRIVGTAHADDRGEFLLLIDAEASTIGPLTDSLSIEVSAFAPLPSPPKPATADLASVDPLWDLPVESLPLGAAASLELIAAGVFLPSGYGNTATSSVVARVRLGEQTSVPDIVFDQVNQ